MKMGFSRYPVEGDMLKQFLNHKNLLEAGEATISLFDIGENRVRVGVVAPDPVAIALRKADAKTRKPRKKTLTELMV